MKFNHVTDTLRRWCWDMTIQYQEQYQQERANTGESLLFLRYLLTSELYDKLCTLTDREFADFAHFRAAVTDLMQPYWNPTLQKPLEQLEKEHVRAAEGEFLEYLATVSPDCSQPDIPYVRRVIGAELAQIAEQYRLVWGYDPQNYWYPLEGQRDESKLFLSAERVEPYMVQISQLLGLPENHIYEYGENFLAGEPDCLEVAEIGCYGGCEVAYTDQQFWWMIYFSHENTVTFAGSIVPKVKEILQKESAYCNRWE